jgi:integrase
MKFTQAEIDRLEPPPGKTPGKKGDQILWDDALPNFGVRIREGGSKTYVIQYKIGAQQRRKTLGSTKALTLEQARKLAKKDLGKVAAGEDPQAEKKAARAAVTATDTFKAVADQFLKYQATQLRPSTLSAVKRYLLEHFKRLHALKIDAVPRREIASILKTISDNHGPVAADRACSAISSLFAYAMREGLIEATPVSNMNKYAGTTSRDRVLKDEELATIWLAVGDDDYGRIIKLLILTGQRRDEIAGLRRDELGDGVLEIPGERTKNHRPHIVPLSDAARLIIDHQAKKTNRAKIFGRGEGGFSGFSKAKKELDAKLPGIKPWTVHDIRRSVATRMAELKNKDDNPLIEPHIIEAVLNHVSGYRSGVAGVYNKAAYLGPKTAALNLWTNHLKVVVAKASGANVSRLTDRSRGLARRGNSA